jgi:SRSO17 transposase
MPIPIICLDVELRQYAERFREFFSKPQWKYFVIVLLGLMLCQETCTMTGLLRQVGSDITLSGMSRFLSQAPWSAEAVAEAWVERFHAQLAGRVKAEHVRQRQERPKQSGRPKATVVTGYLIGDDSTCEKPKGKKMGGLGKHYSGVAHAVVTGHSLVLGLYTLLGRQCPLEPRMYRQQKVCQREGVEFKSKIDIMEEIIRDFTPVPGTRTHVLLDSWYTCKRIWRTARDRGFLITGGLKSNRSLRIEDPEADKGWRWQRVDEYAARLKPEQWQKIVWPRGEDREVYAHLVSTRVRKLYRCLVLITRPTHDCPAKNIRYWASSDLDADLLTVANHVAARWDIEVLFADTKALLGLDHYQLMSAVAILRFWTLILVAYLFLEELRFHLHDERQAHVTLGEARVEVQHVHQCRFLDWLHQQFLNGASPHELYDLLAA